MAARARKPNKAQNAPAANPVVAGQSLVIDRVATDSLKIDPRNARLHGDRNREAIRALLARFGQAEPLVVQRSSRCVIGGNGRLVEMRALGWKEVDVVFVDVDDAKATAMGLALNRTAELATWNVDALAAVFRDLDGSGVEMSDGFVPGFTAMDANDFLAAATPIDHDAGDEGVDKFDSGTEQDVAPSLPDAATTRTGDLWILGHHRLLCGDSASRTELDRLLDGAKIQLVNTDPPYNVKVEPRSNNAIAAGLSSFTNTHHQGLDLARHPSKATPTHDKLRPKDRPLQNDFVTDDAFAQMLRAWFGNLAYALEPGRGFYIWGGYANVANYPSALAENGLYFSQSIIWVKEHPVLTRKDFMGNHEWCFYGWREGAAHQFLGPNNATDVWSVKKLNHTAMVHLTEKPIELAARAIQYSSRPGENVLDLFGGSGSTLMAAEQLDRRSFLMEMDTLYCDVIVQRWQNATGLDAVVEGSGETWNDRRKSVELAPHG